ncbi:MAG: type IV pili methyl-accepting chemotaxis transducer N-terminal domain-containing protein, partial [Helicobacter sp.]
MTKIVTRLIVIGIITTICVGIMMVSVILINQRSLQDGYLINIAGKQRMLTQKIAKEIFMINSQNKRGFDELNQSIKDFESNLDILQYGSQDENINASTNLTIIKQLNSIKKQWLVFKKEVQDFQKKAYNIYIDRNFLEDNNLVILRLSDRIVQTMVEAKIPQHMIDEAGKQRMLIQRMAYLLIHYTNQWDGVSYRELKEVCDLYDSMILSF